MNRNALHVTLQIDGGARGNPGPAGAGVVIRDGADGTVLYKGGLFLGRATCNAAEYQALLAGLRAAKKLSASRVDVASDSELLVRQMRGEYRVKNAALCELYDRARRLCDGFDGCAFRHVSREENAAADKLANMAMNVKRNVLDAAE